ncbi:MAG: hypothetical protein DHS20C01_12150 [marine bacterium B5-7]|nr:MAG: hypothetical protein DHS20C01_12150 [marine bacterium B5-7]
MTNEQKITVVKSTARTVSDLSGNYPLSYSQQSMLAATQLHDNSQAYNIHRLLRVSGSFSLKRLRVAIEQLTARHESLRTGFNWVGEEACQTVLEAVDIQFGIYDVTHLKDSKGVAVKQAENLAKNKFDISQAPLHRCHAWHVADREYVLLFVWHHLIFDNLSVGFFLESLFLLYHELPDANINVSPIQYRDFVAWQTREIEEEHLAAQYAFWENYLTGVSDSPALPFDFQPSTTLGQSGGVERFSLSSEQWRNLCKHTEQLNCSPFDFLSAVLSVLIYRYSGQGDFCLGSMSPGRGAPEYAREIGLFSNNVVLRQSIDGKAPFSEVLVKTQGSNRQAFEHQDYPYDLLIRQLYRRQRGNENPWFDVLIDLHEGEFGPDDVDRLGGQDYQVEMLDLPVRATKYLLTFDFQTHNTALEMSIEYNSEVFLAKTIHWMGTHLLALLEHLLDTDNDSMNTSVDALPLYREAERLTVMHDWNDTDVAHPVMPLHIAFEQAADQLPTNIAVKLDDDKISYSELDARANQLARALQLHGIGRNKLVGVCAHRSLQRMIALLGILKAGGAFLPLDPDDPEQRLEALIEDAEPHLILAEGQYLVNTDVLRLSLDSVHLYSSESSERLDVSIHSGDLAYLIYTSGSTGRPKGVVVSHQAINN